MVVTIHAAPLVEQLYCFGDSCSYDQRDEPICIMDAIYTHEGERVYLSGLRGRFNKDAWRAVRRHVAMQGAVQAEYEHGGKQKIVDLLR